ncbi:hypothetical protein NDU88_001135 [Pleurodeles waltl]|uniref:Uncharacterized protein n=1 Tax=Pleurodeles waltl TaxID=8319 RepID=A0AAV7THF3_PLEWA|nr:hypothetical protein NDU88_001135 [Pleurodeles waltl]
MQRVTSPDLCAPRRERETAAMTSCHKETWGLWSCALCPLSARPAQRVVSPDLCASRRKRETADSASCRKETWGLWSAPALTTLREFRVVQSARFRLAQLFLSEAHGASQRDRATRQGAAGIPPARRESLDLGSYLASAPDSTAAPPALQLGGDVFTPAAGQIAFFAGFSL